MWSSVPGRSGQVYTVFQPEFQDLGISIPRRNALRRRLANFEIQVQSRKNHRGASQEKRVTSSLKGRGHPSTYDKSSAVKPINSNSNLEIKTKTELDDSRFFG